MAFKKCSYYIYDAKVIIKCDQWRVQIRSQKSTITRPWKRLYGINSPLHTFLAVHTLNCKVNHWRTENASMSHVISEDVNGIKNIQADHILRSWSMMHTISEKEGKGLDMSCLKNTPIAVEQRELPCYQQNGMKQ